MVVVAARLIDYAIFGSLGGLWLFGGLFIVVLYRWIGRFERDQAPSPKPVHVVATPAKPARSRLLRRSPV